MNTPQTTRDALADLRAEIHLWTGDESTPVDLDVLRRAAGEIERLRAALREVREWHDNDFMPGYDIDWAALRAILDRAIGEEP